MAEAARTRLHAEHVALGARMAPFGGSWMPIWYAGISEEVAATRTSVGVFDVGHMPAFRVFGFGAFDYLQGVLTNDLGRISEVGAAQYTLMCAEDGGIVDDVIAYHSGDLEYILVANAGNGRADREWLAARLPEGSEPGGGNGECRPEDGAVELVDESGRTAIVAVQGPLSLEVLRELGGADLSLPPRFHLGEGRLGGIPVLLARTGYTGEDGVEAFCHESHASALWRLLLSVPEVTPCGLGARDVLRLEMGYPLHGAEIGREVDPVTAGLGWAVSLEKGGFVGAESVARIAEEGPRRRLVGLRLAEGVPRAGYAVLHRGNEVGKVASGTFSPTLGEGIALAYVPAELAGEGTGLQVRARRRTFAALVVRPPFVKGTSLAGSGS
ncbi:MAG: glycine cleavage system aminomethyltransferase GcvT [Coriobacteriia bacterium]|nr:glycine cleavage system aminomethyltransferase GcvT [Coriobacteriia bacterium]